MQGIKEVRFPKGLKKVGKEAFYFCGLESLELPDTVEVLDEKAFFKCMYLTEVQLPESIRRIENGYSMDVPSAGIGDPA